MSSTGPIAPSILSTSATTPLVVTCGPSNSGSAAAVSDGDIVEISQHPTLSGTWFASVVGPNSFALIGSSSAQATSAKGLAGPLVAQKMNAVTHSLASLPAFALHSDPTFGAWATLATTSSTYASVAAIATIQGVRSDLDVLEVVLDATVSVAATTPDSALSLFYAVAPAGGSPGAFSQVLGGAKRISAPAATMILPVTLRAHLGNASNPLVFPAGANVGDVFVSLYGAAPSSTSQTISGLGDYQVTLRRLR